MSQHRVAPTGKRPRSVKGKFKPCLQCGKLIWIRKSDPSKRHFCSYSCSGQNRSAQKRVNVSCYVCTTIVSRLKTKLATKVYCSPKCIKIGNQGPWSKLPAALRIQMKKRGLLKHCVRCGYKEHPEILITHHRDRNRKNNGIENIEVLCPNCHALEHYGR
jgi:5-methylcytosine-specific restriction endonuclease McrA